MAEKEKSLLVLARRDHTEAMRVAAGLTIFGHAVKLVFMTEPVAQTEANAEQVELLELADIDPQTTVPEMAEELDFLDADELADAMQSADAVINV